jgi:hypothetical protein
LPDVSQLLTFANFCDKMKHCRNGGRNLCKILEKEEGEMAKNRFLVVVTVFLMVLCVGFIAGTMYSTLEFNRTIREASASRADADAKIREWNRILEESQKKRAAEQGSSGAGVPSCAATQKNWKCDLP